jgi:hypothetical protein
MADLNEKLLKGADELLNLLGPGHTDYLAVLTLQGRLAEVIQEIRQYGQTDRTRVELARVTTELNRLCLKNLEPKKSFNELCGIAPSQAPAISPGAAEKRFLSGAVLYANVLDFSTLLPPDQDKAADFMSQESERFLEAFGPSCWLDFRGGDFLLFLERKPYERREDALTKVFLFGLQLQLKTSGQPFKLGVTLHWEDNATWCYLGNRSYLMGPVLNETQLLMSFSDGGHFFLSENAYRDLRPQLHEAEHTSFSDLLRAISGRLDKVWPDLHLLEETYKTYKCYCEIFTFHDRHKRQHDLYNLYVMDSRYQVCMGNPSTPQHRVAIEYRDKREIYPQQAFIQRLVEADEVSIIALTHEGTAMFLQKALALREEQGKGFWNQLQVVFPGQSVLKEIIDQHPTTQVRFDRWEDGKRSVFHFLLSKGSDCLSRWECLEYNGNLPFVGNWFIGAQNTSVRVMPVLPGADMRETYYMEVFKGTPAYKQLSDAFGAICSRTSWITEWNIYGRLEREEFHYYGVVNRKRWGTRKQFCFPIVLIMLHAEVETGLRSILQKRTIYNGANDIGTFSNISGRMTALDVYVAKGLRPQIDFDYDYQDKRDDIATSQFNAQAGLKRGDPLPSDVWEVAAVREIQEELGLEITRDRLKHHCTYYLEREDGDLFFRIFSLKLRHDASVDELQIIEDARPHANLSNFNLSRLRQSHRECKFNRLLQKKFEEVFLPIFQELGIEE